MADQYGLVEKSKIMDTARMKRALSRLASEIVEENQGAKDLYIVGIRRRGVPLAEKIVEKIQQLEGERRHGVDAGVAGGNQGDHAPFADGRL